METFAFLIPTTSKKHTWNSIEDSLLWNKTITTSANTVSKKFNYTFYIGIDKYDHFFNDKDNKLRLSNYISSNFSNASCIFVSMNGIEPGYLTKMWNCLFHKAYGDGCDFFFQCGDDISFKSNGWDDACVHQLKKTNGIGVVGPNTNHQHLLTQTCVSRKHMEIFGLYFPEEIWNWCCDDWICAVYGTQYMRKINHHYCINDIRERRYHINGDPYFNTQFMISTLKKTCDDLVMKDKIKLTQYLLQHT